LDERGVDVIKRREQKLSEYEGKRNDGKYKQDSVARMETRMEKTKRKTVGQT